MFIKKTIIVTSAIFSFGLGFQEYEKYTFTNIHAIENTPEENKPELPNFTNEVLAIKPTNFGYNAETALDDKLMHKVKGEMTKEEMQQQAEKEFIHFHQELQDNGIKVLTYVQHRPDIPDAVFPDWFTTHKNKWIPEGILVLYPMRHPSRRLERDPTIIKDLSKRYPHVVDLTHLELENIFVEGKGSLVFDVKNHRVFCAVSPRFTSKAIEYWLKEINKYSTEPWEAVVFHGYDKDGDPIYHTDCQLTFLKNHAVWFDRAVRDENERKMVEQKLIDGGYKIIKINQREANNMCSNMFCLTNSKGEACIVMSKRAYNAFMPYKRKILEDNYRLIIVDIDFIEYVGGGSARCMLAEIF